MILPFFSNLFTALHKADFKSLLKGKQMVVFQGQLIFEKDGDYFITTIEKERNDYSAGDYMALPEGAPFELINGKLVYMPSPKNAHQKVSVNLITWLNLHVMQQELGRVLHAPMDVHLNDSNIYQPDIIFISNEKSSLLRDYVYGAPDLVVEILSPGTRQKDEGEKMENYGAFGVREYWLVDSPTETVKVFLNKDHKMVLHKEFTKSEILRSPSVTGFSIEVGKLFE